MARAEAPSPRRSPIIPIKSDKTLIRVLSESRAELTSSGCCPDSSGPMWEKTPSDRKWFTGCFQFCSGRPDRAVWRDSSGGPQRVSPHGTSSETYPVGGSIGVPKAERAFVAGRPQRFPAPVTRRIGLFHAGLARIVSAEPEEAFDQSSQQRTLVARGTVGDKVSAGLEDHSTGDPGSVSARYCRRSGSSEKPSKTRPTCSNSTV